MLLLDRIGLDGRLIMLGAKRAKINGQLVILPVSRCESRKVNDCAKGGLVHE